MRRLTNALGLIFILASLVIGILLFALVAILREHYLTKFPGWLGITLEQVAGVLIATAILSLFWELVGKRALASEVMETANLAQEVREAGLTHIWIKYLSEDLWRERFRRARRLDVFVAYANTWRETYRNEIASFAKRRGQQLRVILPDFDDPQTIASIAARSNKTPAEVTVKVKEAFERYKDLLEGSNCQILAHKGPQGYAVYRFDDECIVTLYRNNPTKTSDIPTLTLSGGSFGSFLDADLNEVITHARVLWSSKFSASSTR